MSGYCLYDDVNALPARVTCDVCGAECGVERGVECYRPFTRGLGRWDRATCPRGAAPWHETVEELRREADDTASPRVRALIVRDIEDILAAVGNPASPG